MLNKTICILIGGKAGVGKSTSAKILKDIFLGEEDLVTGIFPFATGVKQTAKISFGWDGQKDERGRKLLQEVGRVGRDYYEDIWARYTFDNLIRNSSCYPYDVVLVDDWRFPNEGNYIAKNNLYSVWTLRIEAPKREILKGTALYNDLSETSLPSGPNEMYNSTIFNDYTMDELETDLENFAQFILSKQKLW